MNGVFRRRCGDAAEQRELPERADAIRAQLTEMGWAVKDTAQGPQLSKL